MLRRIVLAAVLSLASFAGYATDFTIDPENGDPTGDGSAAKPWKSLQDVVRKGLIQTQGWDALPHKDTSKLVAKHADAPIKGGDTIWLQSGYYGDVQIRGHYNTEPITIAAADGQTPRFRSIRLLAGSNWILRGLHVNPEFGEGKKPRALIAAESHGFQGPIHDVVVENCILASAEDSSKWTVQQWNELPCNGIQAGGTRITLRNNYVKNVNFGISVGASDSLVERNTVENFAGDGLRGLADRIVFQYNTVKNCYDVNGNHDDGFQSWTRKGRQVGQGEVTGIVLRGNTIINYEDPNQPHRGSLQGIGCFDGMYVDWVIENNVIIVDHYHGITLMGARNCRIVNNTVYDPKAGKPGPCWIRIAKHKKGMPSTGCVVRNNLAPSIHVQQGQNNIVDHNLVLRNPDTFFVDAGTYDLRLKEGSPAIDAGSPDMAPETDATGAPRPQGKGIDVGAYEFAPK